MKEESKKQEMVEEGRGCAPPGNGILFSILQTSSLTRGLEPLKDNEENCDHKVAFRVLHKVS